MATAFNQEESIFYDAMDLPIGKRASFVAQKCGEDTAAANRILDLLSLHDSDGILDEQASDLVGVDPVNLPEVGSYVGKYELLEEIGNGGMGLVFRARQTEPVERDVAVKVIKLGMDTRSVIGRFEAEQQTLALMDHPFITQVLDAGATETGRPFFVMELVRGVAINKYCDEHRLSIRDRLELFIKSCKAIQHAHQKGIIHRDIKPTNILVTEHEGEPIPKVIDFGIAKAIDPHSAELTMLTHMGQMLGTPMYMSPEQADLENEVVDTRSDVYSLGCVLYELVTGRAPFSEYKNKGIESVRKAIRNEDPILASASLIEKDPEESARLRSTDRKSLQRTVRGELDWILRKVLSKDPGDRYESASELMRELRAYLDGDSVLAAAPTVSYRVSKFIQRNRGLVISGGCTAIALLASTIIALLFAMSAMESAREARRMADQAKKAEREARRAEKETQAVNLRLQTAMLKLEQAETDKLAMDEGQERVFERLAIMSEDSPELAQMLISGDDFSLVDPGNSELDPVAESPMGLGDEWERMGERIGERVGEGYPSMLASDLNLPKFANSPAAKEPDAFGPTLTDTALTLGTVGQGSLDQADPGILDSSLVENVEPVEGPGMAEPTKPELRRNGFFPTPYRHKSAPSAMVGAVHQIGDYVEMPLRAAAKSMVWAEGQLELRRGEQSIKDRKWVLAEQSLRTARQLLEPSMELDSPTRFKIRLLIAEAMLEQDQIQNAADEYLSVVSDVECMLEKMPRDVKQLLFRLRFQISG